MQTSEGSKTAINFASSDITIMSVDIECDISFGFEQSVRPKTISISRKLNPTLSPSSLILSNCVDRL